MLGVIPVRDGVLPNGALETVGECGGHVVLVGSAPNAAALEGQGSAVTLVELGPFDASRWAAQLAAMDVVAGADVVVLPASPDGRDLAPHLAHRLGRPLHANAVAVDPTTAQLARDGGLTLHEVVIDAPAVATLQPGVRGLAPAATGPPEVQTLVPPAPDTRVAGTTRVVDVLAPDVATMDLAEAGRIVGGGAGLDEAARFATLTAVGAALGAAMGATRVITDRGWVGHERQIGTTGVVVDPDLYLAFGISGAVQHTAGLGAPDHIISVNTDPHCPMMQLADLAVVADANETLGELAARLGGAAAPPEPAASA